MATVDESVKTTQYNVQKICSESGSLLLENWIQNHDIIVAGEPSLLLRFKEPNLTLRFFLRPTEKTFSDGNGTGTFLYYSLCVELMESIGKGIVGINAGIPVVPNGYYTAIARECKLNLNGWKKGTIKVAIEDFICAKSWVIYGGVRTSGSRGSDENHWYYLFQAKDITVTLETSLFQLTGMGTETEQESNAVENQTEGEASMMTQLKNMYAEEENFSDLKLETKDNMTLSAHKFQLSARSPVFRKIIEDEVKKNGFDGIIKIGDVNAKAMIVILHWIYTGELHENLGKVMEEVVEAAVKYQLVDLLKMVDKKVIAICTTVNMFQLFQVAKRIPMPTAIVDISASGVPSVA